MRSRLPVITVSILLVLCGCLIFPRQSALRSMGAGHGSQRTTGTYRVSLVGFKVIHESDDDILEGDGRGDEVYIRSDSWKITTGGRFPESQSLQTSVMGDTVNHSERVRAGSSPPRFSYPGDIAAGLRTGDSFPARLEVLHPPTGFSPARPPTVLWQGQLTENTPGSNSEVVAIAPSVWEWDSRDQSYSERVWPAEIRSLFTDITPDLQRYISSPRLVRPDPLSVLIQTGVIIMGSGHKGGTRPIGWMNDHPVNFGPGLTHYPLVRGTIGSRPATAEECVTVPMLILTASDVRQALLNAGPAGVAVFEIRLQDQHDHGDYLLFLMLEKIG